MADVDLELNALKGTQTDLIAKLNQYVATQEQDKAELVEKLNQYAERRRRRCEYWRAKSPDWRHSDRDCENSNIGAESAVSAPCSTRKT